MAEESAPKRTFEDKFRVFTVYALGGLLVVGLGGLALLSTQKDNRFDLVPLPPRQ